MNLQKVRIEQPSNSGYKIRIKDKTKNMFGHFLLFMFWSMAWLVSADPNKHYLESRDAERIHFGSLQFRDFSENGPIGFSARVRRQLKSGPSNFFIHDTDTEDESGPWGAWEAGETKTLRRMTIKKHFFKNTV